MSLDGISEILERAGDGVAKVTRICISLTKICICLSVLTGMGFCVVGNVFHTSSPTAAAAPALPKADRFEQVRAEREAWRAQHEAQREDERARESENPLPVIAEQAPAPKPAETPRGVIIHWRKQNGEYGMVTDMSQVPPGATVTDARQADTATDDARALTAKKCQIYLGGGHADRLNYLRGILHESGTDDGLARGSPASGRMRSCMSTTLAANMADDYLGAACRAGSESWQSMIDHAYTAAGDYCRRVSH